MTSELHEIKMFKSFSQILWERKDHN
jgi:hypothetical protein